MNQSSPHHFIVIVNTTQCMWATMQWWRMGSERQQQLRRPRSSFLVAVVALSPSCTNNIDCLTTTSTTTTTFRAYYNSPSGETLWPPCVDGKPMMTSTTTSKPTSSLSLSHAEELVRKPHSADVVVSSCWAVNDGCVQFAVSQPPKKNWDDPEEKEVSDEWTSSRDLDFLYSLPVDAISILVSLEYEHFLEGSPDEFQDSMLQVVQMWELLGNQMTRPSLAVRGMRHSDGVSGLSDSLKMRLLERIAGATDKQCSYALESRMQSTIEGPVFQVGSSLQEEEKSAGFTLEVVALKRLRPFKSAGTQGKQQRKRRKGNPKRIESFAVAMSANIALGEVVLDPMCKRGTFLVEASKYWPYAQYIGIDSNRGHLEHVAMNVRSCGIPPIEVHRCKDRSQPLADLPAASCSNVDTIMTCLPFGKSGAFYSLMLAKYQSALKEKGKMVVVVDAESLSNLLDAVRTPPLFDDAPTFGLTVDFVRKPFFQWGRQRSTIVIIRKGRLGSENGTLVTTTPQTGLLPWERSFSMEFNHQRDPRQVWAEIRDGTVPCLAPYSSWASIHKG